VGHLKHAIILSLGKSPKNSAPCSMEMIGAYVPDSWGIYKSQVRRIGMKTSVFWNSARMRWALLVLVNLFTLQWRWKFREVPGHKPDARNRETGVHSPRKNRENCTTLSHVSCTPMAQHSRGSLYHTLQRRCLQQHQPCSEQEGIPSLGHGQLPFFKSPS
jgi:hypothetical protein